MTTFETRPIAKGRVDRDLRLVEANGVLARLQADCGGSVGEPLAIPELRRMVAAAMQRGVKLARSFDAFDGENAVRAFVELTLDGEPGEDSAYCEIAVLSWNTPPPGVSTDSAVERDRALVEAISEATLRLDADQRLLDAEASASDLTAFVEQLEPGRRWTDAIAVRGHSDAKTLHWRMIDGAVFEVKGSRREWTAHYRPLGSGEPGSSGFVVSLTSKQAPPAPAKTTSDAGDLPALGRDLAPVLRQPINRIIANAETIRTRLAGPLPREYADYANDIATAGQHLLSLLDDVADLEVVEAESFVTAPDRIDLGDVARQACGILAMQAKERDIRLVPPPEGEGQLAIAELRRVLQILLNLVNNAIRYTPEGSQVWVRLDRIGQRATVTVADQGRGIPREQQAKVFEKFERLGRSGDGGSGLGLYISRRMARAMDGDLTLESAEGQGARFTLSVPAADELRGEAR